MITKNTPVKRILALGEVCNKCGHCCSFGSGYTQVKELEKIAKHLKISTKALEAKYYDKKNVFNKLVYTPKLKTKDNMPYGPCIFLEEKRCTIQEVKPLHCRIGNCSIHGEELGEWYAINHLVDKKSSESIRQWKLRVEMKPTIKGGNPEDIVGKRKLKEIIAYKDLEKKKITLIEVMKNKNTSKNNTKKKK